MCFVVMKSSHLGFQAAGVSELARAEKAAASAVSGRVNLGHGRDGRVERRYRGEKREEGFQEPQLKFSFTWSD